MEWLLNWLIQGTSLTVIAAAGVRACPRLNAATRERIWWITLALVLAMPFWGALPGGGASSPSLLPSLPIDPPLAVPAVRPAYLLLAALGWATWTGIEFARLGLALVRIFAAKRHGLAIAPDREKRLARWVGSRDSGRFTRLVLSDRVQHAAVLGFRHPVIALSPETADRLSDAELDQVVAHERAHVQRRDDIAALVQRIIAAGAGLHPAVWWLDRALTIEREVACDDWVVSSLETPKRYGACLVKLAAITRERRASLAPGLGASRSELEIRITRLLDGRRNASVQPSRTAIAAALPGLGCLAVVCVAFDLFGPSARELPALMSSTHVPVPLVGTVRDVEQDLSQELTGHEFATAPPIGRSAALSTYREPVSHQAEPFMESVGAANPLAVVVASVPESVAPNPEPLDAAVDAVPPEPMSDVAPEAQPTGAPNQVESSPASEPGSPWSAIAESSVAASQRTQAAAVGTARTFSRFGKSVGAAFRVAVAEPVQR